MPLPILPLLAAGGVALFALSKKGGHETPQGQPAGPSTSFPPLPFPPSFPASSTSPGFPSFPAQGGQQGSAQPTLSPGLQDMVATAIRDNTAPSLTAAAATAEAAGFPQLAQELRNRANQVAVPPPPAASAVPFDLGMPLDLVTQVAFQLANQADPNRLDTLANDMRARGFVHAADLLHAKAVQVRAAIDASNTMQQIQTVLTGNTLTSPGFNPGAPVMPPVPSVVNIPQVIIPGVPVPQPLPIEKSPKQILAESLAFSLQNLFNRAGSVKAAKGKEDVALVKKFQSQEGATADGKYGPGSALKLGNYVSDVPPVMYWPAGANATTVKKFRSDLETLALNALALGNPERANGLRVSAAREKGQGGIVGAPPA